MIRQRLRANASKTVPYLAGKPKGDRSMAAKRKCLRICRAACSASLGCMVKLCLLNPSPHGDVYTHRSISETMTPHRHPLVSDALCVHTLCCGPRPLRGMTCQRQGKGRTDTYTPCTFHKRQHGIACGTRVLWRQNPHSSPSQGKPGPWRRGSPRRRARASPLGGKQGRDRAVHQERSVCARHNAVIPQGTHLCTRGSERSSLSSVVSVSPAARPHCGLRCLCTASRETAWICTAAPAALHAILESRMR